MKKHQFRRNEMYTTTFVSSRLNNKKEQGFLIWPRIVIDSVLNLTWLKIQNKGIFSNISATLQYFQATVFYFLCCLSFWYHWYFRLEESMHRTPTNLGALAGLRTTMLTEGARANKWRKHGQSLTSSVALRFRISFFQKCLFFSHTESQIIYSLTQKA